MPVDDQEGRGPAESPRAEESAPPERGGRRYFTRRNAAITVVALVAAAALLAVVAFLLYRSGQIDKLIAHQIQQTLAEYGIRAEIKEFHAKLGPRTAEVSGLDLYDAQTGERLGRIERLVATVRVEDMWALSLRRNVNLESLELDGLELWVKFDEQGRSNFSNLRLPPPDENQRITFSYATARVTLKNGIIHYGDAQHELSGEARNLRALIQPDDPNAPAESRMNRVELALDDSTFTYDGSPVNNISVAARGRVDQTRAEIQDLTLRSPLAEAHLAGTLDDWRNLRYRMQVTSTVDLTQVSQTFGTETPLRGAGKFVGTLAGEGAKYQVEGGIESDALAAGDIRLKNLNVTARGSGEGADSYEAQARAVAELLTAGDFVLNLVQVRGGVMGTGTDFKFLGELRAAAARSGENSIANLILSDAVAEYRDQQIEATAKTAGAGALHAAGAQISGLRATDLRLKLRDAKNFDATVGRVSTGAIAAKDTRVGGINASNVTATARGGVTQIATNDVRVVGAAIAGAQLGSINIAGVRLSIHENGRVEGSTTDVNLGTVAFKTGDAKSGFTQGRAEQVRLARPVFVIEPSGRYRASADLSLGGGVLGDVPLGRARSNVVASNDEIRLNDFTAEAMKGNARGSAVINMASGPSRVSATFEGLDVGNLLALATGRAVPVAGASTGSVNLSFPGTDFKRASGTLNAQFTGETGDELSGGRTPLAGAVALRADRGLFNVERANLRTGATQLSAAGQFSFEGNSNLQVNLASDDAAELQRVVVASNLVPVLEDALHDYGVELAGRLEFNGTVRGALSDPIINGRAALASLRVNGRDLGALTASVDSDAATMRVPNGRLAGRDGGAIQFALNVPRAGRDNISLEATLDRYDVANLLAALPQLGSGPSDLTGQLVAVGPTSGRVGVAGLPGAMSGSADLRAGPGQIKGEPFEQIIAKATFSGANINIDALDARFRSGRLTASGRVNTDDKSFDLRAEGKGVRFDIVQSLFGAANLPNVGGTLDFTAQAAGVVGQPRSYRVNLDGEGRDVTINGQSAGVLTLTGRTENERLAVRLTTGILGQPQLLSAEVNLAERNLPTTVHTSLNGADLTQLFATLLAGAGVRVAGSATGTLDVTGPLLDEEENFNFSALRGTARFSQFTIQIEDIQLAAEDPLVIQFTPSEVTFDRTRFTGPNTNLVFGGTAALGASGRQNFSINGDLNLRVLNGLSRNNFFAGVARIEARVTGSFEEPRVTGLATVSDATLSTLVEDQRITVQNVNGVVRFTADRAEVQSLTGTLGGGRIGVTGGVLLAGYRPTQFQFNVTGEQVRLPLRRGFNATADLGVAVRGSLDRQFITGTVNLRRAEYTENIELTDFLDRRRQSTITEGASGEGGGLTSNVQLDLRVEGRDSLIVRNNLADMVGSVMLQVRGSIDEPIISGRISATRGTINFIRNQRFELTRAFIDLPPRQEIDPVLNVQAESEIKGYRTIVQLTGPLSQPTATVRSEPSLPQADVVSLILTGNLASNDQGQSALTQTGVGTAASLLTETLVSQPVQRATDRLFGLNRFEIDPLIAGRGGSSPTARLTVGRQINRDLSVTYSTNVTSDPNQVLALEYRVSDRISFVAQYQQGSVNTLRAQRDNFSFEIRFRRRF